MALLARSELLRAARAFFAARDVLEVETPLLAWHTVTEPAIRSFAVPLVDVGSAYAVDQHMYLQTSPEYAMKRLLAAGSGDIFQICKVFRRGETGARHNPEFTMLEWYRCDRSLEELIEETVALICSLLGRSMTVRHWTYRELFAAMHAIDPMNCGDAELAAALRTAGIDLHGDGARGALLDLAYDNAISRVGVGIHTICNFPIEAAALARLATEADGVAVARRVEVVVDGVEIANGYHELRDAAEQRQRFVRDQQRRQSMMLDDVEADERLLTALEVGLPDCAGVAVGLDRVLMLRMGVARLDAVLTFPFDRA